MNPTRIIGLVLLAAGIVLLVLGINATQSTGEEIREGLTGNYSDRTVWYIIGGIAGILVGGALALYPGKIAKHA